MEFFCRKHVGKCKISFEKTGLTRRERAGMGVCFGAVKCSVRALIGRGYITANNAVRAGKKAAHLSVVTPKGIVRKMSIASAFLSRKIEAHEIWSQEIEDLRKELGCKLGARF